jgi:hypothetical protein
LNESFHLATAKVEFGTGQRGIEPDRNKAIIQAKKQERVAAFPRASKLPEKIYLHETLYALFDCLCDCENRYLKVYAIQTHLERKNWKMVSRFN